MPQLARRRCAGLRCQSSGACAPRSSPEACSRALPQCSHRPCALMGGSARARGRRRESVKARRHLAGCRAVEAPFALCDLRTLPPGRSATRRWDWSQQRSDPTRVHPCVRSTTATAAGRFSESFLAGFRHGLPRGVLHDRYRRRLRSRTAVVVQPSRVGRAQRAAARAAGRRRSSGASCRRAIAAARTRALPDRAPAAPNDSARPSGASLDIWGRRRLGLRANRLVHRWPTAPAHARRKIYQLNRGPTVGWSISRGR
jgi:hypothetical protein